MAAAASEKGHAVVDQCKEQDEKGVQSENQVTSSHTVDQCKEQEEKAAQSQNQCKEQEDKGVQTENQVIACKTLEQFKQQLDIGVQSKKLVVVDFTASWCGPCRFIVPIMVAIAKSTPYMIFLKVDVDEVQEVADEYKVEAMPTIVFIKDGKEVKEDRIVGARKHALLSAITKHATLDSSISL